jgi:GntR family transcriptional regulator
MALNRHTPVPLYYQLAEQLRELIRAGELRPGDQVPSERDLSDRYAISRMTVRQALGYLIREGTLVAEHGRGTFVAEPKLMYDVLQLLGFTEAIVQRGGTPVSQVLEQRIVTPPASIAQGLRLASKAPVHKIVRLRLSNSMPLLLETSYLSAERCPDLEQHNLANRSLYEVLEQEYGILLKRARQTLEATAANVYESQLFNIPAGTPMILLEGITSDYNERPIEYFKAVYRGDRFKLVFDSERLAAGSGAYTGPRLSLVLD